MNFVKKHLSTIVLVAVFAVGLGLLVYPTFSDWWNSHTQSRAIADYAAAVQNLDKQDYEALFAAADDYNQRLSQIEYPLMNYEQVPGYREALNVENTGIMGYIAIDKIKVELPIYHGTSEAVLAVAAGHLEGTDLPVGGPGTHAVISAHRGLPSAKLFTNLDRLEIGDRFTVTVLDRVLTYEVDQISIVEPNQVEGLYPVEGMDYCTLLTCTPYGINTHRLLVRGVRVETDDRPAIYVAPDAYRVDPYVVAPVVAVPMLLVLLVYLLARYGRTKDANRTAQPPARHLGGGHSASGRRF